MEMKTISANGIEIQPQKHSKMGLPVPHITSFCCCLGLEMGARIIAFLHLIASICVVVASSVFAVNFSAVAGTAEDAGDHIYTTWYKILVAIAIMSTCHVFLALTLLYGVAKRNTTALRVWVLVMVCLWVAAVVFNVVAVAMFGTADTGSDIFLTFLQAVIFFVVLAYFILCVHSFYLMLKSSEDMDGPHRTPY